MPKSKTDQLVEKNALERLGEILRTYKDKALKNLNRAARRRVTDRVLRELGLSGRPWSSPLGKLLNRVIDSIQQARKLERSQKRRTPLKTPPKVPVRPGAPEGTTPTWHYEIVVIIRDHDGPGEVSSRVFIDSERALTYDELMWESSRAVAQNQISPKGKGGLRGLSTPFVSKIHILQVWRSE